MPNPSADLSDALERAMRSYRAGRFDQAEAVCNAIVSIEAGHLVAVQMLAAIQSRLGRSKEALANYDKALAINPGDAGVLNNRGVTLQHLKRFEEALESYDQALAIDPGYAGALDNRGNVLRELKRLEDSLASYDKALAVSPDDAEALNNRGITLQDMARFEEALTSYRQAQAARFDYASAHMNEALCNLLLGDFERGWLKYEWRWRIDDAASARRNFPWPLWLGGDDIAGKTILLHAEQGIGDTIQFCRFAKLVKRQGAAIVLEVQPELTSLIASLDPTVRVIARGDPLDASFGAPSGDAIPKFDYHCPLLSLPLAFKTTPNSIPAEIPYLSAPEQKTKLWRDRLGTGTKPRIGLAWAGNPRPEMPAANRIDRQRSIGFDQLAPLFGQPGCEFYSLQKGNDAVGQLRRSIHRRRVVDWTDELKDFSDTAALIENLDLIIAVDTAVAHLAGALGKPFWLMNRFNSCWRWLLDREDSPWYPTARIFRQPCHGDWSSVIESVASALRQWSDAGPAGRQNPGAGRNAIQFSLRD
jgi:Tfp pilus assembly protein PilF